MIERLERGAVVIFRLAHGKAAALDLELLRAIDDAFAREEESAARAVVLTGTGSIFSAGVDLFRVVDGGRDYLAKFLPALDACFRRLLAFEKPLVAAINGHAIAGGFVLACASDRRILARGRATYGAPELEVGVPFPPAALELVRLGCPPGALREVVLESRIFGGEDCLARGLVDEVVAPEALLERAVECAAKLSAPPARSFAITKRLLRRPALERLESEGSRSEEILDAWASDEVLGAIREYVQRVLRK
ncbi:MAG: enoyl-CoA hydratase/isomerase family protein [Planctomycetota bacterium]